MPYVLLMVLVLSVNLVIFAAGVVAGWWLPHARNLEVVAAISQVNLLFAILPRQHWLVNSVSWLATRPSTNWPLRIRWRLAQYYHLGGAHVGGALAASLWYVVYIALLAPALADGEPGIDDLSLTLAILVVVTLLTISVLAIPGPHPPSRPLRGVAAVRKLAGPPCSHGSTRSCWRALQVETSGRWVEPW